MVRTKADAGGSSGSRKGIVFDNTSMHLYFCNSGQKIKKARAFNLLQGISTILKSPVSTPLSNQQTFVHI